MGLSLRRRVSACLQRAQANALHQKAGRALVGGRRASYLTSSIQASISDLYVLTRAQKEWTRNVPAHREEWLAKPAQKEWTIFQAKERGSRMCARRWRVASSPKVLQTHRGRTPYRHGRGPHTPGLENTFPAAPGSSLAPILPPPFWRGAFCAEGAEAVVHGLRAAMYCNPSWVVLSVAVKNAFNSVNRAIAQELRTIIPSLVPFFHCTDGAPSTHYGERAPRRSSYHLARAPDRVTILVVSSSP
eukprot:SM000129S26150  [mRNA]  locus=s129:227665:229088:- [translate_table: standard]